SETRRGDPAAVLNAMAAALGGSARRLAPGDDSSIGAFGLALNGGSPAQPRFLTAELTANPPFVPAVLLFAHALVEGNQQQQAAALLERAEPAFSRAAPIDRAR